MKRWWVFAVHKNCFQVQHKDSSILLQMASISTVATTATNSNMITMEIPNFVRVYKDGTVERLQGSPFVPPTLEDPTTKVSSKDVIISNNPPISARVYLQNRIRSQEEGLDNNHKVPILVYFHGGGFFFESAFSQLHHNYLNMLVSVADILVVSVEYRLAPETPLPAAYHDCWEALKWVATDNTDPWLPKHGDFNRVFIGGDSAGGNIAHNIAMRIVSHPYFFGSKAIGCEAVAGHEESSGFRTWEMVHPSCPGGLDNPLINPLGSEAPSLSGLGCWKVLVCTAERDVMRDRAVWYYERVKKSGWEGEVELYQVEGEEHVFHIYNPRTQNAHKMLKRFADFLLH